MPENLDTTYIVNSGSEANDLAILLARLYTKNYNVLALNACYHGKYFFYNILLKIFDLIYIIKN